MPHMLAQEHMGFIDALRYGTARTQVTLAAALSAIGSSKAILVLTFTGDGLWTIGSTLAVPANVTLWIPPTVTVSVSAGVTFTITGSFVSFNHTWLTGAGTTVFNPDLFTFVDFGQIATQEIGIINPQASAANRPSMFIAGAGASPTPTLQFYPIRGIHGPSVEWLQAAQTAATTWQILGLSTGQLQFSRVGGFAVLMLADIGGGQGGVGLGNLSTPTHILQLGIDDAFKATTLWSVPSDQRLKTILGDFLEGLPELRALPRLVRFTWNGQAQTPTNGPEQVGWVAQEAAPINPGLFTTYEDKLDPTDAATTSLYSANYSPVLFMLVNAVKDLAAQVDALTTRVAALEAKVP
jgi:hypothetical protein